MPANDPQGEITALEMKIKVMEDLFWSGIRTDKEFEEMKKVHLEIKALKKHLLDLHKKHTNSHQQ